MGTFDYFYYLIISTGETYLLGVGGSRTSTAVKAPDFFFTKDDFEMEIFPAFAIYCAYFYVYRFFLI